MLLLAYDNGAPNSRLPPLGWSSWVALGPDADTDHAATPVFDFCDEVSVKASMDAFVSDEVGLYKAGYRHFHLDDCWADLERNASGYLQAERDHFPNGMAPIVQYAHAKGLTFGLYTCAGTHTCVGGRPGSKGHFVEDANVFAEWAVDVVKMDWCNTRSLVGVTNSMAILQLAARLLAHTGIASVYRPLLAGAWILRRRTRNSPRR